MTAPLQASASDHHDAADHSSTPAARTKAHPVSQHRALDVTNVLGHIFDQLKSPADLLRASHVCRSWRDTIMVLDAARLWPAVYRKMHGLQYRDPPLVDGPTGWEEYRRLALTSAVRDTHDWYKLKQLGKRLATSGGKCKVSDEQEVELGKVHIVRKYAPIESVVAWCPHFLDVPNGSAVTVTDKCIVFEPRVTGQLRAQQTRSFLQVQPISLSAPATTPPAQAAILLSSGRAPVEQAANRGNVVAAHDSFFKAAGATATKWAFTRAATHVHLYPLSACDARICVAHPKRLRILDTSCCDDWLVVLYQAPPKWVADFARNPSVPWRGGDDPSHMATPCIMAVYDLRAVQLPQRHIEPDRCPLLDAAEVGIKAVRAVWVPYEHGLTHAVVDPDAHPVLASDPDPWATTVAAPHAARRQLLKVAIHEQSEYGRTCGGHRLVVVTFDVSTASLPALIAWQPYGIVPENPREPRGPERDESFATHGPCCCITSWRLFGRVLVGTPSDGYCCPRLQFARDDSGLDPGTTLVPEFAAILMHFTRKTFMAVSVLMREPLLRAFHYHAANYDEIVARHVAQICGTNPDLTAQYDLRPTEADFFCSHLASCSQPRAEQLATWSVLLRPAPLRIRATLPRMQQSWYQIADMHWTRRDRLVALSRPAPWAEQSFSSRGTHNAATAEGARIEVIDTAAMRVVARTDLPPTTSFRIRNTVENPPWRDLGTVVPPTPFAGSDDAEEEEEEEEEEEGPSRRVLMLPKHPDVAHHEALSDAWVLDPLRRAWRPEPWTGASRRRVHAPGTVLHIAPTAHGLVVVRSLGPMRGSIVELCTYSKSRAPHDVVKPPRIGPVPVSIADQLERTEGHEPWRRIMEREQSVIVRAPAAAAGSRRRRRTMARPAGSGVRKFPPLGPRVGLREMCVLLCEVGLDHEDE
ncbi:hypothetical protein AMAG_14472 [Allomyces macrogynus ATCC 38327]|uniref:F-box domain-containing protein n=1 Tax=Allomyces macrogynus (strain ATCC 38327) TaxID=578462 RepID=A0A0L0T6F6_ALLM3|nr:hypothetical protein AMAG_14472 [Allomyces macrogynus ATCC 38327]|eukprot:KNE70332.1 hypothetical protein AMAG_14472 [Allomyces macrogynus ATCC 38327]